MCHTGKGLPTAAEGAVIGIPFFLTLAVVAVSAAKEAHEEGGLGFTRCIPFFRLEGDYCQFRCDILFLAFHGLFVLRFNGIVNRRHVVHLVQHQRAADVFLAGEELAAVGLVAGDAEAGDRPHGDGDAEGDAAAGGDDDVVVAAGLHGEAHLAGIPRRHVAGGAAYGAAGDDGSLVLPADGHAVRARRCGGLIAVEVNSHGGERAGHAGGVLDGELHARREVVEEQLAAVEFGLVGRHGEDDLVGGVAVVGVVHGELLEGHGAGTSAVADHDVVAVSVHTVGVDGVEGGRWRAGALDGEVAGGLLQYCVARAVEVDLLALYP